MGGVLNTVSVSESKFVMGAMTVTVLLFAEDAP